MKKFHEIKDTLISKFSKLITLEEKLLFWKKALKMEYFLYLQYKSKYYCDDDLVPPEVFLYEIFEINPTGKEIYRYNEYLIAEMQSPRNRYLKTTFYFLNVEKITNEFGEKLKKKCK